MKHGFVLGRHWRRSAVAAVAVTSVAGAVLATGGTPAQATPPAGAAQAARTAPAGAVRKDQQSDKAGYYDSRREPAARKVLAARADRAAAHPAPQVAALRATLGTEGVVDLDPLTGTPRQVARLDGFLTAPSTAPAARVALDYVRVRPGVFGLDAADLATLRLTRDYVDVAGTHHLSWSQHAGAVPVFGNGLKANVTKDGRLVNVQGSPLRDVPSLGATPGISAAQARARAATDVDGTAAAATSRVASDGTTTFSDGGRARLVAFQTVGGPRLAWQTITTPAGGKMFLHVVDAASGRVLYRQSLSSDADGRDALVWENYPGATIGGKAHPVDLSTNGWLPQGAVTLDGRYAHAYSDVNDDNVAQKTEEVAPYKKELAFAFKNFNAVVGPPCAPAFPCSWNPKAPFSWKTNRAQNTVQVFYFVSKFHDHLLAKPIGFTRSAGNFDKRDGDALQAQSMDGANTAAGLPDPLHVDNANMSTPPDGIPPTMQMYLFPAPGDPTDPFLASNGGDEADVVYHEYTHGLSNRLVVDANGVSTLGTLEAGSMGEAWSDWYAFDFLVSSGYVKDTRSPGDILVGRYVGVGQNLIRTQPLDCPVGTTSAKCPGTPGAGRGGYTYGDFGRIIGQPEVHADGEIWGETLWDLRAALGSKLSESLVTRAMELSPANPSFLDERNAILQADLVVNGGKARTKIWKVFAHRGMGWFAGAVDGDDTAPAEDFSLPPAKGTPKGTLSGVVTDDSTGKPVAGATVRFGGHASGFPGDYAATTAANGSYRIPGILVGTYPAVAASGPGYDRQVTTVSVNSNGTTRNFTLRRDWAALSGGSAVAATNADEGAPFGCGAAAILDGSTGTGVSADRVGGTGGTPVTAKFVTVKLPQKVDVTQIAVDPTAACGDGGSASTGPYRIETSADGVTFALAASGTFTAADRNRFATVVPAAGTGAGVQYVRYTMLDSQVGSIPGAACPGPFSGCSFIDSRELEVYGTPAP